VFNGASPVLYSAVSIKLSELVVGELLISFGDDGVQ